MGFSVPDDVMDKNLDEVALSDRLFLCSQQPTTYNEAATTYNLATVTLTAGSGNGDWLKGNGDVSGRKLTMLQQSGTGSADGTANHGCFAVAGTPGTIKFISTMEDFAVEDGVGFVLPEKDIWEIRDPT